MTALPARPDIDLEVLARRGSATRVLVAFASRHGATRGISAAMAQWLPRSDAGRSGGLCAGLAPVQRLPDPVDFDAVVRGSAVYAGRWLDSARDFSSGLVGERPGRLPGLGDAARIGDSIGAQGYRVFPGRLNGGCCRRPSDTSGPPGPAGPATSRDWWAVRVWSEEIAVELVARHARPAVIPGDLAPVPG